MKLWNYIVLTTLLAVWLDAAGISIGAGGIFSIIGLNLNNIGAACISAGTCQVIHFSVSNFLGALFNSTSGILAFISGGVVIAGLLYRSAPEKLIGVPFITGTVYLYIKVFVSIVNYSASYANWVTWTVVILIGSLGIGFAYSIFDWLTQVD